jgi:hypothetical protein
MSVLQLYIKRIEKESKSVVKVMNRLNSVKNILNERLSQSFLPLKVKELLTEKRKEGFARECAEIKCIYSFCIEYLSKWMKPLEYFYCFSWMTLNEVPNWNDVSSAAQYLINRGVSIDDANCFD